MTRTTRRLKLPFSICTRGQAEASFHWVFVLVAAGVFLALFAIILRSCVQSGETRADAADVLTMEQSLQTYSWYTGFNTTISSGPIAVSCPTGQLWLRNERASRELRAPVFLPAELGGTAHVSTLDVSLPTSPLAQLAVETIVFSDRYEYILVTPSPTLDALLPSNVRRVAEADVPRALDVSAKTGIIVAYEASQPLALPEKNARSIPVIGVRYDRVGSKVYFNTAQQAAELPVLAAGAVASGDDALYACSRNQLLLRIRAMHVVAHRRAQRLSDMEAPCGPLLASGATALGIAFQAEDDRYLSALREQVVPRQRQLYEKSCPVLL
jgi:hypothetical protein